eukprot:1343697-Amphidinium_carterae.2
MQSTGHRCMITTHFNGHPHAHNSLTQAHNYARQHGMSAQNQARRRGWSTARPPTVTKAT